MFYMLLLGISIVKKHFENSLVISQRCVCLRLYLIPYARNLTPIAHFISELTTAASPVQQSNCAPVIERENRFQKRFWLPYEAQPNALRIDNNFNTFDIFGTNPSFVKRYTTIDQWMNHDPTGIWLEGVLG